MKKVIALLFILAFRGEGQVLDVNGDNVVGAEEAIAVSEQWKGQASRPNDHNHLGQTWTGNRNPLTIRGNFPPRLIVGPVKTGAGTLGIPQAPLILDNTSTAGSGEDPVESHPDLVLGGIGIIESEGSLSFQSNSIIELSAPTNISLNFGGGSIGRVFFISGEGIVMSLEETGNLTIQGTCSCQSSKYETDHPLDPKGKTLSHSNVGSPEMLNLYRGNVFLDDQGEVSVSLPDYFEALNSDYSYHLTPIGAPAPNLHVADEIKGNEFKIAGGTPGMKVSWQVTGIRQDQYAKANPIQVESEKTGDEKGKYLHPELYGEPISKSVGLIRESNGDGAF